uniref:hypothetical protein n=1 Tax=Treponema pectinovorum TaxID=164 RepID=UPI00164EA81B
RKLGEKIGSTVAGKDEVEIFDDELPGNLIPSKTLPYEITNQYMTGEPKYTGQKTAKLEGEVSMKLGLDVRNNTTTVNAEVTKNTTRNIHVNTGSAIEARNML